MLEIIETDKDSEDKIIPMGEMKPLQVGVIVDGSDYVAGSYVLRTPGKSRFEVMNLTNPREDNYWSEGNSLKVRLLNPGESITIRLFNEE